MSNINFSLTRFVQAATLFLLFLLIASSCSKNESIAPTGEPGNAALKIELTSIEDAIWQNNPMESMVRSAVNRGNTNSKSDIPQEKMITLGPLDVLISATESKPFNILSHTIIDSVAGARMAAVGSTKMSTSRMINGVYYRLIMFDQNNNQVVNQVIASGSDPNIRVDGSRTYRWYALSVNETQPSVPTVNTAGMVTRASLFNKDVLYASGTISTVDGDNFLNIQFKRKTARTQVRLNVRGAFGTINNATQLTLVKGPQNAPYTSMGDFNILTESFSNISSSPASVNGASMELANNEPSNTVKLANFYTLDTQPIAANQLRVVANRIDIRIDDGRDRVFSNIGTITYQNAHAPEIGGSLALSLRLLESAVKVKGIMWARSNIVYDSNKTDRYRLKSNPGGSSPSTRDTEFWNWGAETPNGAPANVDPCTRVYPENTWRMPTSDEWRSIGQPDEKKEVLGLFFGAQYAYVWNRDSDYPANPSYDDNNLFLSFGGYRTTNNAVVGSPVGIFIGFFATGECHYWTGTSTGTNTATAVLSSFTRFFWGFSWGNVSYPNSNKSEGRNIRCVRQVVNN